MVNPSSSSDVGSRALPVFIHSRALPNEADKVYTVSEICGACEKRTGFGSILGAQKLGVWRIYPASVQARTALLLSGVVLRGVSVSLFDKNPLIVSTRDGEREINTTKLTIGNIPISASNEDILDMTKKLGVKPRSALFMERDRDSSGGLTRWLTGRRFIYIEVPEKPLPKRVDIGPLKASLFHVEQKETQENQQCGKCLQKGHASKVCPNGIVCLTCKKPGHKRGSTLCEAIDSDCEIPDQPRPSLSDPPCPPIPPTSPTHPAISGCAASSTAPEDIQNAREGRPRYPRSSSQGRVRSRTPNDRKRPNPSPTSSDSPGKLPKKSLDIWKNFRQHKSPDNEKDKRSASDDNPSSGEKADAACNGDAASGDS